MAKTEEKPISKIKIRLHVQTTGTSTIYRNDGFPSIDEKTEKAVQWLFDKGYKPEEIEIKGEKPSNWDATFTIV